MLIEYVVFGALVVVVLVATFVGMRRRRADMLSAATAATLPSIDGRPAGADGTHHAGHSAFGGCSFDGGGFDGGGDSHNGGGSDGGGGHHD